MPKKNNFPRVDPKQSFPELEEAVLKYWQKEKIFEESVEREPTKGEFKFFDGPPFATGLPHYGHILQGVIKDLIPRYKTMRGYRVPRVWGWDCHGLPVENLIEKELKLKDKAALEKYGVDKFNEACRASVLRYASEWKKTVSRMGRWIDMEHDYQTMDVEYMDSVWWVFGQLWEKGLIYEGLKPMHVCPRCVTPLSNFEVGQGYKDITDLSCIAKFKVVGEENTYLLAWTTTPWTLPGNVALAVNPEMEYAIAKLELYKRSNGQWSEFISYGSTGNKQGDPIKCSETPDLENPRIEFLIGEETFISERYPNSIIEKLNGEELVKKYPNYEPLFPYYAKEKDAFKVVTADFVTTDEGTGIVHIAPAFGEDDMQVAKANNLPTIQHVSMEGMFEQGLMAAIQKDFPKFKDIPVKQAGQNKNREFDEQLVKFLKSKNLIFDTEPKKHSYPHCWRCETPLLNYATKSWFVAVEQIKDQLLKNNEQINWVPSHIKAGRFGKWLAGARDWAISRNRYWGAPLPVWRCDSCEETVCVSSKAELEKLSGEKVADLHKHFVDKLTWQCKCGGKLQRIPEVLDCWFESGSMPYAQSATKDQTQLPADFIAEAQDQTRGWFYTLHVLGTALFDQPVYENVVCSGLVLAEDGQKMSKSKRNYPDPSKIFHEYGADAMRLYLMSSPVVEAKELRFAERGVEETLRSVLLPLWNTYYFFSTYANADGWEQTELPTKPTNKLDRWILSELNILIKEMTEQLESYEINAAVRPLAGFLDGLTNWYVRRSRRRFWKSESDTDKNEAYATLLHVLTIVSKLLAPVCPFLAERIYRDLTSEKSVHLTEWPVVDEKRIDEDLSKEIKVTQQIISLGLKLRAQENIKIRQPLKDVSIVQSGIVREGGVTYDTNTICQELNVKTVSYCSDNADFIEKKIALINAKLIGPKFPKKVQEIISAGKNGDFKEIKWTDDEFKKLESKNIIPIQKIEICGEILEGIEFEIQCIGREGLAVVSEAGIVVALDTTITPALKLEGRARDLVRAIQDLRKQADYDVSDRIELSISGADEVLKEWADYIQAETLAEKLSKTITKPDAKTTIDDTKIAVRRLQK